MSRPSALASSGAAREAFGTRLTTTRALHAPAVLRAIALGGLAAALVIAPFQGLLFSVAAGGVAVTELDLAMAVITSAWLAILVLERRLPDVPRFVAVSLVGLALVTFVSAWLAADHADAAIRFALRGSAFWVMFLAAADLVRTDRTAIRMVGAALTGLTLAAAVGLAAHARGTSDGLIGIGRDFTVLGELRLTGPFAYPNTAAMSFEAGLLAALPLAVLWPGWRRVLAVLALVTVGAAMLLTFSRGAVVGALAGLGTVVLLGILARAGRRAAIAAIASVALVAGLIAVQLATSLPLARLAMDSERERYGATYVAPAQIGLDAGGEAEVPVTVTNTGAAPWVRSDSVRFALSYRWFDGQRGIYGLEGTHTELPVTVLPGQATEVQAVVLAPDEPGRYVIAWDVLHEGVTWLSERGVPGFASAVVVGDPDASPDAPAIVGPVELWPDRIPTPSRAELWTAAMAMIRDQPLLGVGPGSFRSMYGPYLGWDRWDERISANDLYLELAATVGLPGLGLFLAVVGRALLAPLRRLRRDAARDGWLLRACLIGAIVAFLAHGVVDYFFGDPPTSLLFWVILGIGLGLARRPGSERRLTGSGIHSGAGA